MSNPLSRFMPPLRTAGFLHDLLMAALVFVGSHVLVYGPASTFAIPHFEWRVALFVAISGAITYAFSLNRGSWRYASLPDLMAIVKAALTLTAVFTIGSFLFDRGMSLPRTVAAMMFPLLVVMLGTPRLLYRLYRENSLAFAGMLGNEADAAPRRYILVHTLNDRAEAYIRSARSFSKGQIAVIGIIDDRKALHNQQIQGVRVLGDTDSLGRILTQQRLRGVVIEELVIADTQINPNELARIVEKSNSLRLPVSRLPELGARLDIEGKDLLGRRPIGISDLLDRSEAKLDLLEIRRLIAGRVVLITGAGGSIGSELARQVALLDPKRLVLTDSSEHFLFTIDTQLSEAKSAAPMASFIVDVRDAAHVDRIFAEAKPEVVFHAAALKHVPIVEANGLEGIKTNVLGTRNVADAALRHGAKAFVMISTDKAVNPTNIMGATKRAAEAYCQSLDVASESTRFKTVRFGNVLGSNGSVVPRFENQIKKGGPVTVTHPEIIRYFMSIPEAVRLVLEASSHGLKSATERGKILVLKMGEPVKIVDLARKMIVLAGKQPDIDIMIEFTGLRQGEKLYEELFSESEAISDAADSAYLIASPRYVDVELLHATIVQIEKACFKENEAAAIDLLRQIVPEYVPEKNRGGNVVMLPDTKRKPAGSPRK